MSDLSEIEQLIDIVQTQSAQRLPELNVPRQRRGKNPRRIPRTVILSYAAQETHEARLWAESVD